MNGSHAEHRVETDVQELLERLLAESLDASAEQRAAALDRMCDAHPEHAQVLRSRFAHLTSSGFLDADAAAVPDERFGEYRIRRVLGRGGMGVVYLAEQPAMARLVALKVVRSDLLHESKTRKRFRREVEAVAGLDHPGICTVYDAGEVDGSPYIAMRFVDGETLADRLRRQRSEERGRESSVPTERRAIFRTLEIVERVARALHVAHEAGLVHRDVKPGNIILTGDDQPVLVDFGLARLVEGDQEAITLTGDAPGTPAYMSPEQIEPRGKALDRRADVYSLGVTLFEALTLQLPFEAATRDELYRRVLTAGPPDASRHNRSLSVDVRTVLATAMARDADARYDTALAFAEDLQRIRRLEPILARRPSWLERGWRWARREPLRATVVALLAIGTPTLAYLAGALASAQEAIQLGESVLEEERIEGVLTEAFGELLEGSPRRAVERFDEVLRVRPDAPIAIGGKALAFERLGQRRAARAMLQDRPDADLASLRTYLRGQVTAQDERPPADAPPVAFFFAGLVAAIGGEDGDFDRFDTAWERVHECMLRSTRTRRVYLTELAHFAGHTRDGDKVRAAVGALLQHWPDAATSLLVAGKALTRHDPARALELLRRAVEHPDLTPQRRLQARAAAMYVRVRRGDLRSGDPEFEAIATEEPQSYHDRWMKAQTLFQAGDWGRAKPALEAVLAKRPKDPQVHHWLAHIATSERRFDDVIRHCRAAIAANPRLTAARVNLGTTLVKQGKAQEGLEVLREATRRDPTSRSAQGHLGRALRGRGRTAEARRVLHTAIDLDPEYALARRELGMLLTGSGDRASGIEQLRLALQSPRLDSETARHLARDFYRLGELSTSLQAHRKLCELRPDDDKAWNNLGNLHRIRGEPGQALAPLRKAVAFDPENETAQRNLAIVLVEVGDGPAALSRWRARQAARPDDPVAKYYLARSLWQVGRSKEALPWIEQAHSAGRRAARWPYPTGRWRDAIRAAAAREPDLAPVVAGTREPHDAAEARDAADLAHRRGEHARAVELFERAFAIDRAGPRELAARAAARLAGTVDAERAAALREQARRWLAADLDGGSEHPNARNRIRTWRSLHDLSTVRDPKHLAELPAADREAWTALWKRVDEAVAPRQRDR